MKKIAIITAIVLTTALTAFSLSKKENKTEVKLEAASNKAADTNTVLATAD
jgi:hypothetical protein